MTARLYTTVYASDDLPTEEAHIVSKSLGTVDAWTELEYEVHEHGTGKFIGTINRHHPQAALLVADRYLLVHSDAGVVGGAFLEAAPIDLSAADGPGDEWMVWGGRGQVAILERGRMDNDSNIVGGEDPIDGFWDLSAQGYFAGSDSGHAIPMLKRALVEMQLNSPSGIDVVDHSSWDYLLDTDGNVPPFSDGVFGVHVGDDGLTILQRMDQIGDVVFPMSPLFKLDAYGTLTHGTDRSGAFAVDTVRFEKGVNVATAIARKVRGSVYISHLIVGGGELRYQTVVDPDWVVGEVVRWGFLAVPEASDPGQLTAAGLAHIERRKLQTDAWELPLHDHGDDPTNGIYEPAPDIADGHFWLGDLASDHTGSGAYDADEEVSPIASINWKLKTGDEANGDYQVTVGVGSTFDWSAGSAWAGVPGSQGHSHWLPHKRYDDFARSALQPDGAAAAVVLSTTPANAGMGLARSGRPWRALDDSDDAEVYMTGYQAAFTIGPAGNSITAYVEDPKGVWLSDDNDVSGGRHVMHFLLHGRFGVNAVSAATRQLKFFMGDIPQISAGLDIDTNSGLVWTGGSSPSGTAKTDWIADPDFTVGYDFLWELNPFIYSRVKVWRSTEEPPEAWTLVEIPDAGTGGPLEDTRMGFYFQGFPGDVFTVDCIDVIHGEFAHGLATDADGGAALAAATSFLATDKWSAGP